MLQTFLQFILLSICLVHIVLLLQSIMGLSRYRVSSSTQNNKEDLDDIPTVSLCIPARNETHALAECLESVIASDYPKLEVLVLDDCSQDTTSQVIRGFAHEGIRFVKGDVPSDDWLGKNNAYETLAKEAKGKYLVFMSVDTRLSPNTISNLIAYMQLKKLGMVSVLPQRFDNMRASVIFAPLRYFWQVVLPLKFNTPFASSLWAIETDSLQKAGGFEKYKSDIRVENKLAQFFADKEEYRFFVSNSELTAKYEKKWVSQTETSVRLWFPTLKRNVFFVVLASIAHILLFVFPFTVVLWYVLSPVNTFYIPVQLVLAVFASVVSVYVYFLYFRAVKKIQSTKDLFSVVVACVALPYIALQEVYLMFKSMVMYLQGKVEWKGRNVCFPVTKRF